MAEEDEFALLDEVEASKWRHRVQVICSVVLCSCSSPGACTQQSCCSTVAECPTPAASRQPGMLTPSWPCRLHGQEEAPVSSWSGPGSSSQLSLQPDLPEAHP
jgi:hypothetical protein